ncbi:MAG: hypothetical protein MUC77_04380 [Chromatiaceae bacterium]|jgi:hypothetical protein|nr:hypothetical protein [Chromatiaceae bacterium]
MLEIAAGALLLLAVLAFGNWRAGLVLCVLTAVLQDPLRKLVPNEPGYFVLFAGLTFAAAAVGAIAGGGMRPTPNAIQGWKRQMGPPLALFLLLVILQAAHSLVRFGIPQMTIIGLISYLAPLAALVFAYHLALAQGLRRLRQWMWFYALAAGGALVGVYLEYAGFNWAVLGEVGRGLVIYDVGTVLKAYSGFFRSSEIAAWHTAAVACFLFILLVGRRITLPRLVIALALVGLLAALGVLTGRRKLLVVVTVFLSSYAFLVAWFQYRATRPAVLAAVAGVLAYLAFVGVMEPDGGESSTKHMKLDPKEKYAHYTTRSRSVFEDIPERFENLGLAPIRWAVNRYGVFGAGLGTGSQGVQHVQGAGSVQRGAAEGGLGKITMELGVPGLCVVAWLILAFARYVRNVLAAVTKLSPRHARVAYGLVAFLIANAASFSVATQAFGDVFVLVMLGWAVGFVLAMPVLAARELALRQQRILVAEARPTLGVVAPP